jgi:uncharacterized protein
MATIYLDSCLVIYLVEQHPRFYVPLRARIAAFSEAVFSVSALTRLECLTRPLREQDSGLVERFESFLQTCDMLPIDDGVLHAALDWRVAGLKTPDALHVAVAKRHRCTAFWTNDDRLAKAVPEWSDNVLQAVGT